MADTSIIKEAVEKGLDLKEYASSIENDLARIETEHLGECIF